MKSLLGICLFIWSYSVSSNVCEVENPYLVQKVEITDTPNYFFRALPYSNHVSYATDKRQNKILNLDTGEKIDIPGQFDPVPSPDGKLITTPQMFMFYNTEKLLAGENKRARVSYDQTLGGQYQSIGEVEANDQGKTLRIITDEEGITAREYHVSPDLRVSQKNEKRVLCPGRDIKIPMLSKDGQFLAARDMKLTPSTTRIFKLSSTGDCEEVMDLGLYTGKVDFSYDGRLAVFHQSTVQKEGIAYFEDSDVVRDVFLMNLETKQVKKITNNSADKSSYHPVWKPDNSIVFLEKNALGVHSFVTVNPTPLISDTQNSNKINCDFNTQNSLELIGEVWKSICLNVKRDNSGENINTALSLSTENCTKLVEKNWQQFSQLNKDRELGLTKKDLLAACPQNKITKIKAKKGLDKPVDAKKLIEVKCNICHGDISKQLNEETLATNSKASTFGAEISNRIRSNDDTYKMPRGSEFSKAEKISLENYINSFNN